MSLPMKFLVFMAALVPAGVVQGNPECTDAHFISGGKRQSLCIGKLPQETIDQETGLAGIPVWFKNNPQPSGLLTSEIVVRFSNLEAVKKVEEAPEVLKARKLRVPGNTFVLTYSSPYEALIASNRWAEQEDAIFAHPDFVMKKDFRTGDPLFPLQWHLENTGQSGGTAHADINFIPALAITHGRPDVLIAVLDMDFDLQHEDYAEGIFRNAGEIPGNQIDDDGNGFIDDVNGWSFYANGPNFNLRRADHGTSVLGIAGARLNGIGVTGTCPVCQMLPVALSFRPSSDAEAFHYAATQNAAIITNSWGYDLHAPLTDVVVEAIDHAAMHGRNGLGSIILFAMTNTPYDNCQPDSPDISSLKSVIAVSASDNSDKKIPNAGYGNCLDFLAPSRRLPREDGIVSTDVSGGLGYNSGDDGRISDENYTSTFGGTSAATPAIAGVIGLMLSVNPSLTREDVFEILKATSEKIDAMAAQYDSQGFSSTHGYGRINAAAAVQAANVR